MSTTYLAHPPPFTPHSIRGHNYNPDLSSSTIRLLYLNPNGLANTNPYVKTAAIVNAAHQFHRDGILCAEVNAFMGNVTIRKGNEAIFKQVGNGGSLLCGYNTYHIHASSRCAYPTALAGGVCQWFGPKVINRLAHQPPDPIGRFVTSTIIGPRNQAISIITVYRPVKTGSGLNPVIAQHKRVLGRKSDPRRQILLDLTDLISDLQRKGDDIIVAMDANEELPSTPSIIPSELEQFLLNNKVSDAMTTIHGYEAVPSCDRSSRSPIDFIFCSPSLLRWLKIAMLDKMSGCPSDHRTFIIDVDTAGLWRAPLHHTPSPTPRGFTSANKPRTTAYINRLHDLLRESDFNQIIEQAQHASANNETESIMRAQLERADNIMTSCMLRAEQFIMPR